MKATMILSGVFAAAAMASPLITTRDNQDTDVSVRHVTGNPGVDTINYVDDKLKETGIDQLLEEAAGHKRATAAAAPAIPNVQVLITKLSSTVNTIKTQTNAVNTIAADVTSGKLTKKEGSSKAVAHFKTVHFQLSTLLSEILGAAGLKVSSKDLDKVLTLVTILVKEVLTAVKGIVTATGLSPQLSSILHSVFNLLTEVLSGLVGLLGGLLPGLVAVLTPLLHGLGQGVLAPLLTPLAALLSTLTAPGGV